MPEIAISNDANEVSGIATSDDAGALPLGRDILEYLISSTLVSVGTFFRLIIVWEAGGICRGVRELLYIRLSTIKGTVF